MKLLFESSIRSLENLVKLSMDKCGESLLIGQVVKTRSNYKNFTKERMFINDGGIGQCGFSAMLEYLEFFETTAIDVVVWIL